MFDRIWKEQIAQTKGKLGIWKPKSELQPREEEKDDKCCEEARAWALQFHKKWLQEYTHKYVKEYPCDELYDYLQEYIDNRWHKSSKVGLRIFGLGMEMILEEWDKCEGR